MCIKSSLIILLLSLSTTVHLYAQKSSAATMQVSVTVTDGITLGVENLNIYLTVDEILKSYSISPMDDNAATYSIYSTPGRNVSITFENPVILSNSLGDILELSNFILLIGDNNNPIEMTPISPMDCTNLRIPDNGMLYLRIGGTFSGSITTKGLYSGNFNLDSGCMDF